MRAHQLRVERAVVGDQLRVVGHRRREPLARRPETARGEAPERRREPRDRDGERLHPAPVDRAGELPGSTRVASASAALHRLLQRMPGVEVALDRPALRDRERDRRRRACPSSCGAPARACRRRRAEHARRPDRAGRPAPHARSVSSRPAACRISRTRRTWSIAAAVRRAGEREVLGGESEALGHPGAHAAQRLERLRRRAREDPRTGIGGGRHAGPRARRRRIRVAQATRCSDLDRPRRGARETRASPITTRGPGRSR